MHSKVLIRQRCGLSIQIYGLIYHLTYVLASTAPTPRPSAGIDLGIKMLKQRQFISMFSVKVAEVFTVLQILENSVLFALVRLKLQSSCEPKAEKLLPITLARENRVSKFPEWG